MSQSNFPIPYKDELLYSVIARAGVHNGITSPKELLSEVFSNRKVIATVDLPYHIEAIERHYPVKLGLDSTALIYKHTLFPLYAPFVPEKTRVNCLKWLKGKSYGSAHLALGIAASRVRQVPVLRYCSECLIRQYGKYGEYYWQRRWQVTGADCCIEHGALVSSPIRLGGVHRHQFFDVNPGTCPHVVNPSFSHESQRVSKQVYILLNMALQESPTFNQWTNYYKHLAIDFGVNRGRQIDFGAIKDKVLSQWSHKWLKSNGLTISDKETCWLKGIFRKHRKSFSYLEHIVVLDSFLPVVWRIDDVVAGAKKATSLYSNTRNLTSVNKSPSTIKQYRLKWSSKVTKLGVTKARRGGYGKYYAWLYKHDKEWLLSFNRGFNAMPVAIKKRVDWAQRDRSIVKQLISIRDRIEYDLSAQRWSRNWFLKQLDNSSSIEKHLPNLPLTRTFFSKFCESIEDFQIRRLTRSLAALFENGKDLNRCYLLRESGLSEERLKPLTKVFLGSVVFRDWN